MDEQDKGVARGGRCEHDMLPASELYFCMGQKEEAVSLVKTFHYSQRSPSNIQFVGTFHTKGGLFGDFGPAVAAIFFSIPPTRWSEEVLELSRLVRTETCRVPLTRLVSLACSRLRADGFDLLVSFADSSAGHHGGIYQACSWNYDGQRERQMDGLLVNGQFVPGRTCNGIYGTRSPDRLRQANPDLKVEPHYDAGKHLYWRALARSGEAKAVRLGLKRLAYPKPDGATIGTTRSADVRAYLHAGKVGA
jgi:hypothetical protein